MRDSFSEGMLLLKRCVQKEVPNMLQIVKQQPANSVEDIVDSLDAAIMNRLLLNYTLALTFQEEMKEL